MQNVKKMTLKEAQKRNAPRDTNLYKRKCETCGTEILSKRIVDYDLCPTTGNLTRPHWEYLTRVCDRCNKEHKELVSTPIGQLTYNYKTGLLTKVEYERQLKELEK